MGTYANYIYGPLICYDTIDQKNHTLLCGSWREFNNLQLFDLRNLKLYQTIEWRKNKNEKEFIYSCKLSKHSNDFILAGVGGNRKELLLFTNVSGKYQNMDRIEKDDIVFSIDFEHKRNHFSYAVNKRMGLMSII